MKKDSLNRIGEIFAIASMIPLLGFFLFSGYYVMSSFLIRLWQYLTHVYVCLFQ